MRLRSSGDISVSKPPADAPALNTGLQVRVMIDSLDGTRFWGRVTLWFAGDVGISPSAFESPAASMARTK